jgi:hypothetical protein
VPASVGCAAVRHGPDRRSVGRRLAAGARREEGRNSRALRARGASGNAGHRRLGGPARTQARSGAARRVTAQRGAVRRDVVQDVLVWLRSAAFFPKFLNRSALNNE